MDLIEKYDKKLLVLPALFSFVITLLLLYKYSYPISWDVYYHIHMINLYMQKGLVFWDYSTVAPHGRLIMYPPLFHLVFAFLSNILNIEPVQLCRMIQPLFSFYLIGVITYVSYELTDKVETALLTGFLSMFCFVTFNRSVICTPATLAIGLFMLSCLFIYKAVDKKNIKYIFLSALCLALIWNLHMATAMLTCGVVGLYSLMSLFQRRITIKYVVVYIFVVLLLGMPWWIYISLNYPIFFNSLSGNNSLIINFFFRYYGILPSLSLLLGYYVLIKQKSDKALFLFVWSLSLIVLSQLYYLGFNIVSVRILEVASYCLIIISGIGLSYFYEHYIGSMKIKRVLWILFIVLSVLSALLYVDSYTPDILSDDDVDGLVISDEVHLLINPVATLFKPTIISSRFADTTLAHDRYKVMKYFVKDNSTGIVVCEDAIMDTIIVSTSRKPVIYGGFTESIPEYVTDPVHIIKGWSNADELHKLNVDYLLLKHNTSIPYYAEVEYNNSNYQICKIRNEYR